MRWGGIPGGGTPGDTSGDTTGDTPGGTSGCTLRLGSQLISAGERRSLQARTWSGHLLRTPAQDTGQYNPARPGG